MGVFRNKYWDFIIYINDFDINKKKVGLPFADNADLACRVGNDEDIGMYGIIYRNWRNGLIASK